jgi:hypothetical protein
MRRATRKPVRQPRGSRRGLRLAQLVPTAALPWLGRGLLHVAAWAGLLGATYAGLRYLGGEQGPARLAYADEGRYPARLVWDDLADWMNSPVGEQVLARVEEDINLPPKTDVHFARVCDIVHARAQQSPWIERVHRVSRQADNVIHIRAEFRKPAAWVVINQNAFLVDRDGHQLQDGEPWAAVPGQLVIRGVRAAPPRPGNLWPGEDLAAGIRLVETLTTAAAAGQLPHYDLLRAVDVSGYPDAYVGVLRLMTASPEVEIIWGRAPGDEQYDDTEASVADKLARLRQYFVQHNGMPPAGTYDLRPKREIWRRPP